MVHTLACKTGSKPHWTILASLLMEVDCIAFLPAASIAETAASTLDCCSKSIVAAWHTSNDGSKGGVGGGVVVTNSIGDIDGDRVGGDGVCRSTGCDMGPPIPGLSLSVEGGAWVGVPGRGGDKVGRKTNCVGGLTSTGIAVGVPPPIGELVPGPIPELIGDRVGGNVPGQIGRESS